MTKVRTIGDARSSLETRFFLELERCPQCGERDIGVVHTQGGLYGPIGGPDRPGGIYDVTCPRCGHQRSIFVFKPDDYSYLDDFEPGHLGGPAPSTIIQPHQFAKELAWCMRDIEKDLSAYERKDKEQRRPHNELWAIGRTCAIELGKFIPAGADEVPETAFTTDEGRVYRDAHREEFTRAYLDATLTMLGAIRAEILRVSDAQHAARIAAGIEAPQKPLPLPPFSLAALKFHEEWVAHGDGPTAQRMTGKGVDVRTRNLAGRDLSGSDFENINFDRADLRRTRWHGARLVGASALRAPWTSARLTGATIERCVFTSSPMVDAYLFDSVVTSCRFIEMDLTRTLWFRSTVISSVFQRSTLVDASFDGATFADCDFVGSDFSVTRQGPIGTAVGARFVRCDLRDTNWEGRDLFRVSFIACKLAGARGLGAIDEAVFEDTDLSVAGDGSQVVSRAELLQQWGVTDGPGVRELVYELTPDDASHVEGIARANGWSTRTWVVTHADGYRHWVRVREVAAASTVASTIEREMRARGRAVPVATP